MKYLNISEDREFFFNTFFPIFSSIDEYKRAVRTFNEDVSEGYAVSYLNKFKEAKRIVELAKIFIIENWEKIEDWSELEITIKGMEDNSTEFFIYKGETYQISESYDSDKHNDWIKEMNEEAKKKHNPVYSVSDVILDIDGDFSITINDKTFLWLRDDEIITIASYIESKLI